MNRVQIKICGITRVEDAKACTELGADMIGLNFYPQSSRYIQPQRARQIVEGIPRSIHAVGVFVDPAASEVRAIAKITGIECVQLHGDVPPDTCRELAREFRVIRAFSTGSQFQPNLSRSFDELEVLIGERQDRDLGKINLLRARERQQQIERTFITGNVDDQRRFAFGQLSGPAGLK